MVGDIDDMCRRLNSYQKSRYTPSKTEETMPIVFNEFCTSWGVPSEEKIKAIASILNGRGIKYFVIDAGWYAREGAHWSRSLGDWKVSEGLFPSGLKQTVEAIKACGMIPGLWFEMEVCAVESYAFKQTEFLLKRDGIPLTSGERRFFDMTNPKVTNHLKRMVIDTLKEYGFGYIKIDYNDNLGIGCDGYESLGEGVRQQVLATQSFMGRIREEIPDIVIENCSSGGHRLEPSFLEISDMVSFSDAHESLEIPIVGANVRRQVLPEQSQMWAVIRKDDSLQRIYYSMISTFFWKNVSIRGS